MNKSIWMMSALVVGLTACGQTTSSSSTSPSNETTEEVAQQPSIVSVGAEEFEKRMEETPGYLLDVRTPAEFAEGHIEGANLINFYDSDFKDRISELDKSETVYVYCRSGGRSGNASRVMEELGFQNVVDLSGGITSWKAKGHPTVQ
ncbi:rhodanese-like domain-containing protein [Phaeocystidibacter marisrubri]|nr:rhodanese-like domain-containing protein [Phaeocystidibacter marisrubri]GGH77645.1 rhodanese-like domain-containing protein [Phaeocystidibacter marisrubri]